MKEFLLANWPTAAIIAAFLIYVIYLVVTKKWAQLRGLAYKLMLLAEKAIVGTKQGQNRFNAVFVQVYSLLPAWFRLFVPTDTLKAKLQEWYTEIADYMDNGKIDGSVQPIVIPAASIDDTGIPAAVSQAIEQTAATTKTVEMAPVTTAQ